MKYFLLSIIVTLSTLSTWAAPGEKLNLQGQTGSGGGVTVNVDGKTTPRDLAQNTACRWVSGNDFVNTRAPGVRKVIERLKAVHWVFARQIQSELHYLTFCETEATLKQVEVNDQDGFTIFMQESEQAAIRLNYKVWVDMKVFRKMASNPEFQDAMVIHEIMHSLLPIDIPRRNDSLRSMVATLMSPLSADSLAIAITANQVYMMSKQDEIGATEKEFDKLGNVSVPLSEQIAIVNKIGSANSPMRYYFTYRTHPVLNEYMKLAYESDELANQHDEDAYEAMIEKLGLAGDDTFYVNDGYSTPLSSVARFNDKFNNLERDKRGQYHFVKAITPLRTAMWMRSTKLVTKYLGTAKEFVADDLDYLATYWNKEIKGTQKSKLGTSPQVFETLLKNQRVNAVIKKLATDPKTKNTFFQDWPRPMVFRTCLSLGQTAFHCRFNKM